MNREPVLLSMYVMAPPPGDHFALRAGASPSISAGLEPVLAAISATPNSPATTSESPPGDHAKSVMLPRPGDRRIGSPPSTG